MSLAEFKEKLRGWMVADGDEYCLQCWPKWLAKFSGLLQKIILEDSRSLIGLVHFRCRYSDGWGALCEMCGTSVSSPYDPGEPGKKPKRIGA